MGGKMKWMGCPGVPPPTLFFPLSCPQPVSLKVIQVGIDGIFELIASGAGTLLPTPTPLPLFPPCTTGFGGGEGRTAHPRDDLPIRGEPQAHSLQGFSHISLESGLILVNGGLGEGGSGG